jgi:TolB-like protein/DNA-binding winged helix-turn-helix (wHTH) protein/Flp pilus assembly protein TadD
MEEHPGAEVVQFSGFRFDRRRGLLARQNGEGYLVPVPIGSRALDILGLLIDRHGDLVSRDEILNTIWPGVVEGANVTVQISALRRVLDEDRSEPSLVQTIPGRGYRFAALVTRSEADPCPGNDPARADENRVVAEFASAPAAPMSPSLRMRRAPSIAIAAAVGAVLLVAVTAWWAWSTAKLSRTPAMTAATSNSEPLVAPRCSIVVLPFVNLSNDPDQQYFADGITDDLTTDLSRITDMFVIARNTAFTYRNKPVNAKQIGRELGVRYLLEGSVQRSGNQVRINAQLVDAETGAHLWAERFERDTSDLFALQNEITTRIGVALNQELVAAEAARQTERPDVLEYLLRARAAGNKPPSRAYFTEVISLVEHALAIDPQSAKAQAQLASWLAGRVLSNNTETPAADIERANALTEQALAASPRSVSAHIAKAHLLRAQRLYAEAIPEYETVLAANRNYVYAYFALGQCKLYTGSIEEAIPLIERAIRLSPRDPQLGVWYEQIGNVHLLQSHADEAVRSLEKARNHSPAHSMIRADLAAAYGFAGETERAAAELAEARRLSPTDRYASLARLRAFYAWGLPKIRAMREATYFAGMRKAGMPEE